MIGTIKELKDFLDVNYDDDTIVSSMLWDEDNVKNAFFNVNPTPEDPNLKLTKDDVKQVLRDAFNNANGGGITWDSLYNTVSALLEKKQNSKSKNSIIKRL